MTDHPAIAELRKIAHMRAVDEGFDGAIARSKALQAWIEEWTEVIEVAQGIIKNNLTSEDEDFIKYYLSYKMGEEMMENCVEVDKHKNHIKTSVRALKVR